LARTLGGSKTGRDFESAETSFMHRFFARIMALELGLLRNVSLPFGVALFVAATTRDISRQDDD